jgi:protein-disulfide isomerase
MSVVLGGVYVFASANKKASDERAGDENTKHIIEGGADHSTLKLLESDHRFGSPDAAIQVVMFTDYQCPDCKRLETQLARIYEERSDLSIVVKHFPLNFDCNDEIGSMKMHGNACWAARAAEAAYILDGSDGWARMHTWLFENKGSFTQETFSSDLQVLGFDPQSFVSIMMGDVTLQNVKSDAKEGKALGIWFTPMIFINGVEYLWYYDGQGSLARVIGAVSDAIASGNVSKVAPPLALEKLIEDWRVGRTHGFQEHERLSWSGRGDVEIVVWGDYQTDPTRVINATIKEVLNEDSRAKYSFRHFPIDAACNQGVTKYKKQYPGSCNIAKVVEAVDLLCGDEARWKVHDAFLVSQPSTDLASLAKIASSVCDSDEDIIISVAQSQDVEKIIHSDIQSKLSVWRRSVPVLVIDGRFVPRWEMGGMTGKETILKMVDEASQ